MTKTITTLTITLAAAILLSGNPLAAQSTTPAGVRNLVARTGYNFEDLGNGTYQLPFNEGGTKYTVSVYLSESGRKLWYKVALVDASRISSARMQKMIERQADIGPAAFIVHNGLLSLVMPVDNRALTPEIVKDGFSRILEQVTATRDLWDVR